MKDRQQKRVYRWEGEWATFTKKTLSQDECRAAVEAACASYDVPTPAVKFKRGKRGITYFDPEENVICFLPCHMNLGICLHEAAHAIHSYVTGDDAHEIHGPEWLAIYINLLRRFEVASLTALTASLTEHGAVYGDLDLHSPRRLRATYRDLWRVVEAARSA